MVRRVEGTTEGMGQSVWRRDVLVTRRKEPHVWQAPGQATCLWSRGGSVGVWGWARGGLMIWRHVGIVVQHVPVNGCFVILGSSDPR